MHYAIDLSHQILFAQVKVIVVARVTCFVLDWHSYPKVWENGDSHVLSGFTLGIMCFVYSLLVSRLH